MSVDVYAYSVLGFEVIRADLLTEVEGEVQCARRHTPSSPGAKFCEHDGSKFEPTIKRLPTGALLALMKKAGADADDDPEDWLDNGIYNGDLVHSMAESSEVSMYESPLVCGAKFYESGSHNGNSHPGAIPWEDLQEGYAKAVELREAMGLTDHPIQVFSWMYVSV